MLFPSQNILETSTFHHIFTSFHSGWGVQYYKWKPSDKPSPSDLAKYQYFHARTLLSFLPFEEKLALFIAKRFLKYLLFTTYSLFMRVSEVCNTSNKCWLPNKSTIKIFLHKTPHNPPLFPYLKKKKENIYIYIYISQETLYRSFIAQKLGALHRKRFLKDPLFTRFLLVFKVENVCYISNKYQPNNLAKYQYF